VQCHILIIHGTNDAIINIKHGRKLYESYQGPKQSFWVEGADHNDLSYVAADQYLKVLVNFSEKLK